MPIKQVLHFEFEAPEQVTSYTFSPDGVLTLHGPEGPLVPDRASATVSRTRKNKGPKALAQIPLTGVYSLNELAVLAAYDAVFFIDTNRRHIDGRAVSAAAIYQLNNPGGAAKPTELALHPLGIFEFHGVEAHQENIAWGLLTQAVIFGGDYAPGCRYALITDSDLGNHAAYNAREKPIIGPVMLAEPFTLIYASEEGRGFLNGGIRACDSAAKDILQALQAGELSILDACATPAEMGPFTHFRFWQSPHRQGVTKLAEMVIPPGSESQGKDMNSSRGFGVF